MAHPRAIGIWVLAGAAVVGPFLVHGQVVKNSRALPEERSTYETIPLQSMDQEALADAVIEGGLAPTGSKPRPPTDALSDGLSPFTDPLALTMEDNRSGANRFSLNFDIQYQDPKNIPGIEFGQSYNIGPQPPNRIYDFYQSTTTER